MGTASLVFHFGCCLNFFLAGSLFIFLTLAFRRELLLICLLHFGTGLSGYIGTGEASIECFPEFLQKHLCLVLPVLFAAGMVDLVRYLSQLEAIVGDFFLVFVFDEFLSVEFLGNIAIHRQRQRFVLLKGLLAILVILIRVLPLRCVAGVHINLVELADAAFFLAFLSHGLFLLIFEKLVLLAQTFGLVRILHFYRGLFFIRNAVRFRV